MIFMKKSEIPKGNKAEIQISKTYYESGKIVFSQNHINYELLPKENTMVKVYLGKTGERYFEGNLIFTTNNSARINSVKIREWFDDERLKIGNIFTVEIIETRIFRIYK